VWLTDRAGYGQAVLGGECGYHSEPAKGCSNVCSVGEFRIRQLRSSGALRCETLQNKNGVDRLSRSGGAKLPLLAAKQPRRAVLTCARKNFCIKTSVIENLHFLTQSLYHTISPGLLPYDIPSVPLSSLRHPFRTPLFPTTSLPYPSLPYDIPSVPLSSL
jgi:hypothetical protein